MRLLLHWILSAIALLIVSRIVPGFHVQGLMPALIAALAIGFLNATVGLILKIITFPLTILTLGVFLLVVNGIMILVAANFVPGFHVYGFAPAFWGAVVLALLGMVVRALVSESKELNVSHTLRRRRGIIAPTILRPTQQAERRPHRLAIYRVPCGQPSQVHSSRDSPAAVVARALADRRRGLRWVEESPALSQFAVCAWRLRLRIRCQPRHAASQSPSPAGPAEHAYRFPILRQRRQTQSQPRRLRVPSYQWDEAEKASGEFCRGDEPISNHPLDALQDPWGPGDKQSAAM